MAIRVTVPEVYLGVAVGEIQRHGLITGMNFEHGMMLIQASLPAEEFASLSHYIALATQERGKVERDPPPRFG